MTVTNLTPVPTLAGQAAALRDATRNGNRAIHTAMVTITSLLENGRDPSAIELMAHLATTLAIREAPEVLAVFP